MSSDAAPLPYTVEQGDVGRNREAMLALWRGNLGDEARMLAKFDWFYRDWRGRGCRTAHAGRWRGG